MVTSSRKAAIQKGWRIVAINGVCGSFEAALVHFLKPFCLRRLWCTS